MTDQKPTNRINRTSRKCAALISRFVLAGVVMGLVACGQYGGESEEPEETTTLGGPVGLSQSAQANAFETTAYPVLRTYCGDGCHDTGARSVPLLFANSNVTTAYQVVTGSDSVNLDNPPQSRIVRRPAAENHNCGSQCAQIGAEILAAVEDWAEIIESSTEGENFEVPAIESATVAFTDGTEVENDERYEGNLIAFYGFKEGTGDVARDTSGVSPRMDLELDDDAEWMGAYGVVMDQARLIASADDSRKLYDQIASPTTGTGQYTFEMWINNGNTTQENARIVSYVRNSGDRNFSLHQQEYQYVVRNRSLAAGSENDGRQELITYDVDQDAQETLQHVVVTYDPLLGRRIFVDGIFTDDDDPLDAERLWNWNPDAQLVVGSNRFGNNSFWFGQMRMLAIYKQALTMNQIRQNFEAGVGRRVMLSFDVSDWTGRSTELQFNVTELDSHSYLFCQPTFVGNDLGGIRVKDIRITVNPGVGVDPPAQGQGFSSVDQVLSGSSDQVSRSCSVIAKGPGPDAPDTDDFAIEFEELAFFENPEDVTALEYTPDPNAIPFPPDTGFRQFARVDATMQELTGVDPRADRTVNPGSVDPIFATYEDLKQQLPSDYDLRSIVSSHQVGLTKLAFEYCVEAMDDAVLREAILGSEFEAGSPSFFEQDVATAYANATLADLMSERFTDHMLGTEQLDEQPARADVISELDSLRDDLVTNCQAPCGVEQTLSVAKGMCTAILSSAPMMVH